MKLVLLSHLVWFWVVFSVIAQSETAVFHGMPDTAEPIDLGPYTYFFKDKSGDTLPLSEIQKMGFLPYHLKRNERSNRSDRSMMVTWLNFKIRNSHPTDTLAFYFFSGIVSLMEVYQEGQVIGKAGKITRPSPNLPNRFVVPLAVPPGKEFTYWVRTVNNFSAPAPILPHLLTTEATFKTIIKDAYNASPYFMILGILTGSLFFMSLFAIYNYWLGGDKTFLFYGLYVSACFIQALIAVDTRFGVGLIFPYLPFMGLPLSPMLIIAFYLLFMMQILKTACHFPLIHKVLLGILVVLLFQQLVPTIEVFLGKPLFQNNAYYTYMLVPTVFTMLLVLVLIAKSKSNLKKYLLTGSLSLVVIVLLPMLTNFYVESESPRLGPFLYDTTFLIFLGLTIECFCFALALAYRSRLVELEKNQLQQNYTSQLETELEKRVEEIELKNSELEAVRIRNMKTIFEQKLAETEMTALRSQMNPHFIFNCLNSIKFFALNNDGKAAAEYLTKFARLIRLVLENSRTEKIPLQDELEALEIYLEMEAVRFGHKLHYQIKVDKVLDTAFVEIPTMLIQPYVENAIWHGLMHKPAGGTVTVSVKQPVEDMLQITVSDDGIGRAKAAQLESKSATNHKSFGMKMTSDRIQLINHLYQSETQVQVNDLVDATGEPCGTEVEINIPI